MSKKKKSIKDIRNIIQYHFNELFQKGALVQFIMLIMMVFIVVVIFGVIAGVIDDSLSTGMGIWQSLMHLLDQGTLGGDETDNIVYIVIMFFATLAGIAFMGTIVGIIDNAISDHIDKLKDGNTKVMEEGHLLIIGFDDNIHCIISEQIESNENNNGNRAIVILDDIDIDEMRDKVNDRLESSSKDNTGNAKKKKSKLIYRKGDVVSLNVLDMVSAEKAKAIIINNADDFEVIRIMLAVKKYLKDKGVYKVDDKMPTIVSLMHNEENINAAKVAAENINDECSKIQVMFFEDIIAHIFAQVCRQPGLSWVLAEIFDYSNAEIYIEDKCNDKEIVDLLPNNTKFEELRKLFTASVPIGICDKNGDVRINPSNDSLIKKGDSIIHVAMDDNEIRVGDISDYKCYGCEAKSNGAKEENAYNILIFGFSESLPLVIDNIYDFLPEQTTGKNTITIIAEKEYWKKEAIHEFLSKKAGDNVCDLETDVINYAKMDIIYEDKNPYSWNQMKQYLDKKVNEPLTNIMLLCQDGIDKKEADRKTAVLLLNIRSYLDELVEKSDNADFISKLDNINITSEMNLAENESLLQGANINDFVVGSEIANRMMVQVANGAMMHKVFKELLNDEGSEIYLRYMEDYVDIESDFNWNYVAEVAASKGEIAIGWLKFEDQNENPEIRLNPFGEPVITEFNEIRRFGKKDRLVVIAED